MSDEKKNETLTDRKKEVIQSIQRAAEIYTIASVCTKMPYVFCDPETFDDEVFVFLKFEDAQTAAKALAEEKEPVSLVKVENKQLVFTDIMEFQKFNRENRFRTAVIPAEKIPDLLAPETKGVTINPMTVNLQLQIRKKKN